MKTTNKTDGILDLRATAFCASRPGSTRANKSTTCSEPSIKLRIKSDANRLTAMFDPRSQEKRSANRALNEIVSRGYTKPRASTR